MSSVSQYAQTLGDILEEEACVLARETGFIQRERRINGADFVQTLIFAWLQEPQSNLDGLVQVLGHREVQMSAPGLSQRFTPQAARLLHEVLSRLSQQQMQAEAGVECALLRRFEAVILEDSSQISLPPELVEVWQGNGGTQGTSGAAVKLFVRWDVCGGQLWGPSLTDGRCSDQRGPFSLEELPVGSLYVADLGFFSLARLAKLCQGPRTQRRYVVTRYQPKTLLRTRSGHRIDLRGIAPQAVGEAKELGVLVGRDQRLPMRLVMLRVPAEVAEKRREKMKQDAKDRGKTVTEETLALADWLIVLTNVPRRLLSLAEVFVILRLRWQIERLFRLWKEHGHIDEWRSKNPWRVLTELYAKLCAMLIQQWLIQEGCWADPYRSLVKAAQVVRRESMRLLSALVEGGLTLVLTSVISLIGGPGCRMNRRRKAKSTAQLLMEGLDWPIVLT